MNKQNIVNQDFLDGRPLLPPGTHPIENGRYLIGTPEISRLSEVMSQWIENRTPGGIVYGKPRIGKTRATAYLIRVLPSELGISIPSFRICCKQSKQPNESFFYENILREIGHAVPYKGNNNMKRMRITNFLMESAEVLGQKRILLFFDDAQLLHELHYGWLMDIYNELDNAGISLTVLLIGQVELIHQRSAFIQSKKHQIVGRFMVHEFKFNGIRHKEELKECLLSYDEYSEYPNGSNWSFTRYFFPEAYKRGFRLSKCSDEIYEAYVELRQRSGIFANLEIPMQYLTLTIEYALRYYGVNRENVQYLSKTCWERAIEKSGYIEAEKFNWI